MMEQDDGKIKEYAARLKIADHLEYLPLLFMNRTKNSRKRVGDPLTEEERKFFR